MLDNVRMILLPTILSATLIAQAAAQSPTPWHPNRDGSQWPRPVQFEASPSASAFPHSTPAWEPPPLSDPIPREGPQNANVATGNHGQEVGLFSNLFPPLAPTGDPAPSHRVIRSPESRVIKKNMGSRYAQDHPPHTSHRQRMTHSPTMIPQAKEKPTWKAPYSYGYFGVKTQPTWSKHHGYRDNYTQWTRQ
ncbi:hypothetical protein CA13_44810 [Planctomycetes bacterium CA13]|uniref:Secreted protein n=1 Tax=Novipirellula herctigrandis TaxID=2527986 RepID=A0A5C5Z6X9_9BACT|nr:hypothetical protein CA13_44810 [Planctomycetes bacterium CA13]